MTKEYLELKFKNIIYECNQHKQNIVNSSEEIKDLFHITKERYYALGKVEKSFLDQFIFRFTKLQNTMGEKLFHTLLQLLEEDYSNKPFIDTLNRLEKLELISTDKWLLLRQVRNNISHEYENNIELLIKALNQVFLEATYLLDVFDLMVEYLEKRK